MDNIGDIYKRTWADATKAKVTVEEMFLLGCMIIASNYVGAIKDLTKEEDNKLTVEWYKKISEDLLHHLKPVVITTNPRDSR